MRALPVLLLLTACGNGSIKLGADTGPGAGEDVDGDGFAAIDAGGADCDDGDPSVFPGAVEVWYDDVDQDCDGASDHDQDGDGADRAPVGSDCDDADSTVFGGAAEVRDLADQDCDGLVDEDFVAAGDVVVSEVMHHPLAASDATGEWFEITNVSDVAIDLAGWTISADDGDAVTIEGSLVVEAGGVVVLGADGNTVLNGGVTLDYVYDRAGLSLSSDDTLFLVAGAATVFDVEWTSGWTMVDGRSLSLDPDHFGVVDARQSGFWCVAKTALASGDYGTPGGANDDCTQLDEDGDGASVDDGDCDDTDATISPGLPDVWDGIDNDCDGTADGGDIGDVAVGSVDGPANGYLGIHAGLGLGDVTGDGTPDFIVGGAALNAMQGAMYVISGERPDGLSGGVSTSAVATVSGSTYAYFGATSPIAGDVTGDGVADLVVASGSASAWGGGGASMTVIAVFEGGPGLTGALTGADGDLRITGTATAAGTFGNNRVLAHLDVNGDGLAEIVYGEPSAENRRGRISIFDASALGGSVSIDDADGILTGDTSDDALGTGMGGADVDGDGYDDLFLGASGVDDQATNGGAWYQVAGRATAYGVQEVDAAEARTILGDEASAGIGFGNPALGDFNGDRQVDLAFGGPGVDAVWVYYGIDSASLNLETDEASLRVEGDNAFGFSVAAADLDGDGADDLVAGAPAVNNAGGAGTSATWYYTAGTDHGGVYVFDGRSLGRGDADLGDIAHAAEGEARGDLFGALVSGPADIDGDGTEDLLIGAPRGGSNAAGRVYHVQGR